MQNKYMRSRPTGAIYVISHQERIMKGEYKVGKHKGNTKQLNSRYALYLDEPILFHFVTVTDYAYVEKKLLKRLDKYRCIRKDTGRQTEWVKCDPELIIVILGQIIDSMNKKRTDNSNNNNNINDNSDSDIDSDSDDNDNDNDSDDSDSDSDDSDDSDSDSDDSDDSDSDSDDSDSDSDDSDSDSDDSDIDNDIKPHQKSRPMVRKQKWFNKQYNGNLDAWLSQINGFICPKCGKNFSTKGNLERHLVRVKDCITGEKTRKTLNKCHHCHKNFSRPDVLKTHIGICPIRIRNKRKIKIKIKRKTIIKERRLSKKQMEEYDEKIFQQQTMINVDTFLEFNVTDLVDSDDDIWDYN
jgi:hypothetical protein